MYDYDIMESLPLFYRDIFEFRELTRIYNIEIKTLITKLYNTIDNTFIVLADKEGISRFERLLSIDETEGENLETRRKRVLLYWNNEEKNTYKALLNKLDIYCGEGGYSIKRDVNNFIIELITHLEEKGEVAELWSFLSFFLPCNLIINMANNIRSNISTNINNLTLFEISEVCNITTGGTDGRV